MKVLLAVLAVLFKIALCRDFYVGMFKENDILVAQDTLYKERKIYGFATAKYGRVFHCPITYFRISDRLGVGRPPSVKINRGGLRKKYLTLILTSAYNMPIAVNIYVGCANTITTPKVTNIIKTEKGGDAKDEKVKEGGDEENEAKEGEGDYTEGEVATSAAAGDVETDTSDHNATPASEETTAADNE